MTGRPPTAEKSHVKDQDGNDRKRAHDGRVLVRVWFPVVERAEEEIRHHDHKIQEREGPPLELGELVDRDNAPAHKKEDEKKFEEENRGEPPAVIGCKRNHDETGER